MRQFQPASPEPTGSTEAAATEVLRQLKIVDDYDGDGMELTLDGSSIEAFDASMARIKRHYRRRHLQVAKRRHWLFARL